jgi:hypothetical protein
MGSANDPTQTCHSSTDFTVAACIPSCCPQFEEYLKASASLNQRFHPCRFRFFRLISRHGGLPVNQWVRIPVVDTARIDSKAGLLTNVLTIFRPAK